MCLFRNIWQFPVYFFLIDLKFNSIVFGKILHMLSSFDFFKIYFMIYYITILKIPSFLLMLGRMFIYIYIYIYISVYIYIN